MKKGTADVLRVSWNTRADVNNDGGKCGGELLHLAVKHNQLEIVKLLVEKHADVEREDETGKTA